MTAPALSIGDIIAATAGRFGMTPATLASPVPLHACAVVREIAMHLCCVHGPRASVDQIAAAFRQPRTVVMRANQVIAQGRASDRRIDRAVSQIEDALEVRAAALCTECRGTRIRYRCHRPDLCADPGLGCTHCAESCDHCGVTVGRQ